MSPIGLTIRWRMVEIAMRGVLSFARRPRCISGRHRGNDAGVVEEVRAGVGAVASDVWVEV
jgi:hypothetical protein